MARIFLPFIFLLVLVGLLGRGLFYSKPHELPSALQGEPVPAFNVPDLLDPKKSLSQNNLRGQVTLLNVWATWCYACSIEYPFLMKIKEEYHIPIYGLDYKDDPEEAKKWLAKWGNPFTLIGQDTQGDVAIDFGVYGTPETFVISPQGKIVYRYLGVIDENSWQDTLLPLIKQYSNEKG